MPERVIKSIAELFGVLSHPSRIHIIVLLSDGERDVTEIHELLGISQSSVSQHLGILRTHRIVNLRREGTRAVYALNSKKVIEVINKALELFELEIAEVESLRKVINKVLTFKK